jgi:hypothetical protein
MKSRMRGKLASPGAAKDKNSPVVPRPATENAATSDPIHLQRSLLRKHVAVHGQDAGRLSIGLDMGQARPSPLQILGGTLIRDRMKNHLDSAFIKTIDVCDQEDDEEEGQQRTFSAAAELGGLADQGKMAEWLCRLVVDDSSRAIAVSSELVESLVANSDKEDEVAALILAFPFHSHERESVGQYQAAVILSYC